MILNSCELVEGTSVSERSEAPWLECLRHNLDAVISTETLKCGKTQKRSSWNLY